MGGPSRRILQEQLVEVKRVERKIREKMALGKVENLRFII